MGGIAIRREHPGDGAAIHRVNERAFGGPDEAIIVDALRANRGIVLSLVAELDGTVVGHILFSRVRIDPDDALVSLVALAPMAVAPEHQRRGIGGRLIREGLDLLRAAGHGAVVLVGHPEYYPRFGFTPASHFGLRCEFEVTDEAFHGQGAVPRVPGEASGPRPVPSGVSSDGLDRVARGAATQFIFCQTIVPTLIFPSEGDGAGRVVRINLSPSHRTSRVCVVPVHASFQEMSMWCSTLRPSNL